MSEVTTGGPLDRSIKFEWRKPSELRPYVNNARTHNRHQLRRLKKLIKQYGFTNPILIDEMDVVIGGHARLIAAMELGLETVPTIRTTGLTDTEKKALRLADPDDYPNDFRQGALARSARPRVPCSCDSRRTGDRAAS